MGENRFHVIPSKGKISTVATLAEALAARDGSEYIWLDLFNADRSELEALAEPLGLHRLTVDDCLDDDSIPKVEDFPGYTLLLVNAFRHKEKTLTVEEVDCILGKKFLVTVHRSAQGRLFDSKTEEMVLADLAGVRRGPDHLLHVLLDQVVDRKFHAIEDLQEELDLVEDAVLADPSLFHPADLMHLRRRLLAVRKSLFHEREVFLRVCRRDSPFVSEKAVPHYRDIYDHLARFFELVEISREMISGLLEIYLSMMNTRMSAAANYTNQVVRRLTLLTTVFMPLTLVAGIGGMSEWSMMTGPENWKLAYPLFVAGCAVVGLVNFWLLRWVDRRTRPTDWGEASRRAMETN